LEEHPSVEDFARLLQQSTRPSHPERNALAVRHLLANCPVCLQNLGQVHRAEELLPRLLGLPGARREEKLRDREVSYEWAFAKAGRAFSKLLAEGQPSNHLAGRFTELTSLSEKEQLRRVATDRRFADPEIIEYLLDRSHIDRYLSPRKTLHLALLADSAANACTSEEVGGSAALADLLTRTQGNLANALRICGRVPEANLLMDSAIRSWEASNHLPRIRVTLLAWACALRIRQERFEEAIGLAEEAGRLCLKLGDSNLLARSEVQKAIANVYSGNAEAAAAILDQVIPMIDGEEDPQLLLAANHNLAMCYISLNRPEDALSIYYEARQLYQKCKDPMILLRATWQEGQLLREVGHFRNAEAALLRARQGFIDQGLAYEAAHVDLDLAKLYSKLGHHKKSRQAAANARPILREFGLKA
jgi:tetratricopeptide (TPR) repeat protein